MCAGGALPGPVCSPALRLSVIQKNLICGLKSSFNLKFQILAKLSLRIFPLSDENCPFLIFFDQCEDF